MINPLLRVLIVVCCFNTAMVAQNEFITTWKTDNNGTSTDTEITIPTILGENYNYEVDWTYDGVTFNAEDTGINGNITHDYEVAGTYMVAIRGAFPRIYFNNAGDKQKLLTIEQWGNTAWTSMENAFYGCTYLNITNPSIDTPDLAQVTNLTNMFNKCSSFNGDITAWDVSTVEIFDQMFRFCSAFDQPIGSWNMRNAKSLYYMFEEAHIFNQPLNSWNTSSVTNMAGTFVYAQLFNQDLNNWNVSNVISMEEMFYVANVFNGDITAWNVSKVENMAGMFVEAYAFNQDISGWEVSQVTTMYEMFNNASSFNQDIGAWDVSKVTDMASMFTRAVDFNQDIGSWEVSQVIDMKSMFRESDSFNQDISSWDVGKVQKMGTMFANTKAFNQDIGAWDVSSVTQMNNMFFENPIFNQDISGWDVSKVTEMNGMFEGASSFDQNLGNWDLSSISPRNNYSGLYDMFKSSGLSLENYDATLIGWSIDASGIAGDLIDDIPAAVNLNAGNSQYCNGAVARATLSAAPYNWVISDNGLACSAENYFVSTWKTDNAGTSSSTSITIPSFPSDPMSLEEVYNYEVDWTYDGVTFDAEDTLVTGDITHDYGSAGTYTVAIRGMFPRIYFDNHGDAEKILTIEQWGTNAWTSMASAFDGCENLNITKPTIDVPNLSQVTTLEDMFAGCSVFNGNLSAWDVSKIENFDDMFASCYVFDQDISGWNMSSATNLNYMFYEAESFNQNIDAWNLSQVTEMEGLFSYALLFDQDLNSWNVSNVTSMYEMFEGAEVFNGNISSWDVSKVENMIDMFYSAYLFNQNIGNWNVSRVTSMISMFRSAEAFNQDISSWNVSKVTNMSRMFQAADQFNQDISEWEVGQVTNMSYMFRSANHFDQDLGNWDIGSLLNTGSSNRGLEDMFTGFTNTGLSRSNYDNTLIGWNTDSSNIDGDGIDDIPHGIVFNGGNSVYCNGEAARINLATTHGWTITDGGLDCLTVSTSDFDVASEIKMYPNPSDNLIHFEGKLNTLKGIEIYSLHGQKVMTVNNDFHKVNISQLPSATYFVRFLSDRSVRTVKLIKK